MQTELRDFQIVQDHHRQQREISSKKTMLKPEKATEREGKEKSRGGEFIYRHHEESRLKLCDPNDETFPIRVKYVDEKRQTQTSINNVSVHMINDIWTEGKGVNFSEEWCGTARFQILRTRLLEGYGVNGRLTKIQKTARPDRKWLEAWTLLSMKRKGKLQNCEKKMSRCKQHAATEESTRY